MPTAVVVVSTMIFPYRAVAPVKVAAASLVEMLANRLMVLPVTARVLMGLVAPTTPLNLTVLVPASTVRARAVESKLLTVLVNSMAPPVDTLVSTLTSAPSTTGPVKVAVASLVEMLAFRLMVLPVTARVPIFVLPPTMPPKVKVPASTVRDQPPLTVLWKSTAPLAPGAVPVPPRVSRILFAPRITASVNVRALPLPPFALTPLPPVTVMLPLRVRVVNGLRVTKPALPPTPATASLPMAEMAPTATVLAEEIRLIAPPVFPVPEPAVPPLVVNVAAAKAPLVVILILPPTVSAWPAVLMVTAPVESNAVEAT